MAGNFWQSSHCSQWILEKVDLLRERHADLTVLSEEEYQKIIKWAKKGHRVVVADVTFTMKTVSDETLMAVTRIIERTVATCCLSMAVMSTSTAKSKTGKT